MKHTLILGLTGSVASVLHDKLITKLQSLGNVNIVMTKVAKKHFVSDNLNGVRVFSDASEWRWQDSPEDRHIMRTKYKKGDHVVHISLGDHASALVIAPCSANTLAKLANGLSDNLLTSVARSWHWYKPVVIAPAMNTRMWEHPITQEHITKLRTWGYTIVAPQTKVLACGTEGEGAMAEIDDIVKAVKSRLTWRFPLALEECSGIPINGHPGSFLCKRKKHTHTGVDLYTKNGAWVNAAEAGNIVGIEDFTGVSQQTPWWEDTQCMLIEGVSGVICYGEITPISAFKVGGRIQAGQVIGYVKRVLKPGKERPDINGHSPSMLHIEMYPHGKHTAFEELPPNPDSFDLLKDPTPFLLESFGAPTKLLNPT